MGTRMRRKQTKGLFVTLSFISDPKVSGDDETLKARSKTNLGCILKNTAL